ncbi:hypothetical protein JZ751_029205 [Albula glossodonta]|uniref:non-specific serine/threonine protein kinase n=1 Tax=Albula glossodonta TaxID=121402 RepID=A0A8T2PHD7_9TELE|nr:hypothetical protein JZ751_029205 [Albula glossodonta]
MVKAQLQVKVVSELSSLTSGPLHYHHQDLTALAKELRAVEDVRPPHKVTDYSSSSEESGTTDEEDEDVDQEGADESTSGPEDSRAVLTGVISPPSSSKLSNGETESTHDEAESDPATTPCKDGTLIVRQVMRRRSRTKELSFSGSSRTITQACNINMLQSAVCVIILFAQNIASLLFPLPPQPPGHPLPSRAQAQSTGDIKCPGRAHQESNGFAGRIHHLPDLIQQSHSPSSTSSSSSNTTSPSSIQASPSAPPHIPLDKLIAHQVCLPLPPAGWLPLCSACCVLSAHLRVLTQSASNTLQKHKSSSSFTPFIDPRLLQISPSSGSSLNSVGFGNEARLQEALRQDPSRKGSVVNVNPVNTRPQSDTPEIRKYKKRFNSEILCAALWGRCLVHCPAKFPRWEENELSVNLLVGTESGLMLLDRSGQGKVYPLISRRRFQQMDVHLLCQACSNCFTFLITPTFSFAGKKNKLRVYYLSWLRNKILHNDPEVEKKQGWTTVGDLEGCVHYKSFGDLVHKPLLVDLTVEEGQRLKVIYGSCSGFHAVDVDSGAVYDIYLPTHIQTSIQSHAIIILPNTDGIELLVCYEDEGVYVNTYGRITKDVVLQWGEMPTSVAYIRSNQIMGWGEKAIEIRSVETGHLDGVFMHKRAQRLKFLCERNDKVFFASVRSGGSSQVYFMTLGRSSLLSWAAGVLEAETEVSAGGTATFYPNPVHALFTPQFSCSYQKTWE